MAVLTTTQAFARGTGWQMLALRCSACANALLLLTVMISMLEPLACLTYCQNWAQLHTERTSANQPGLTMSGPGDQTSQIAHTQTAFQSLFVCSGEPSHNLPSGAPAHLLHHEHLAVSVAAALIVLVVLIYTYPLAWSPRPPHRALHPPLRPPILSLT